MFYIVSCSKFNRQTLRIVNIGDLTKDKILDNQMGECQLCGPCSHVEVGTKRDWWTFHSGHDTLQDAEESAWGMVNESGQYSTDGLPPRTNAESLP